MLTATVSHRYAERQFEIREHLGKVLSSAAFASSPRLRQFLTFLVEQTLEGEEDALKEYVIATTVYGRDVTYDPQIDSTVRVEASRLRKRLQDFYQTEGRDSGLEIQLPKGRYVPVFLERAQTDIPVEPVAVPLTPVRHNRVAWFGVLAAVLAGMTLWHFAPRLDAASGSPQRNVRPEVLAKYLRAQRLLRTPVTQNGWPGHVPPSVTEAIRLFEEVTASDPHFARAWVGLAESEEWAYELNNNQPAVRLERAMSALDRAVTLEPGLPDAWSRLSSLHFHRYGNRALAEKAARKAVELNPKDIAVTARLVDLLRIRGRSDEAVRVLQNALVLEPSSTKLWVQRALLAYDQSRYEEALGYADHALQLFSGKSHPVGWWIKGLCLERLGRVAEAETQYRAGMASNTVEMWNTPSLAHLMARTGRTKEAEAILEGLVRESPKGLSTSYQIALVLTGLGRTDEAVAWLERGRASGDTSIPFIGLEKRFDRLRDNPRFQKLL
jgi:tetratricopeptide (TPR) repeat protein